MEPPRETLACIQCRLRKVKCSRENPCKRCTHNGEQCVYAVSRRGRRGRSVQFTSSAAGGSQTATSELATHRFNLPRDVASVQSASSGVNTIDPYQEISVTGHLSQLPLGNGHIPQHSPSTLTQGSSRFLPSQNESNHSEISKEMQRPIVQSQDGVSMAGPQDVMGHLATTQPAQPEELFLSPLQYSWEHQGPLSFVAICSDPGIAWVTQRTEDMDFVHSAQRLVLTLTQRLKVDRQMLGKKAAEPCAERAWQFCRAYFDRSFDSAFGIVNQFDFETRLRAHFEAGTLRDDDPSWFALRNAVYASGCRLVLSEEDVRYSEIQGEAWKYFQNAMSVFPELLFTFTDIIAVRALAAMTFFAEGLGKTSLQYMLCAAAARLAQSKGLHRKPAKRWGNSDSEEVSQSWLFWAIYCYEKLMVLRSARPSAILDEEISCPIPAHVEPGNTAQIGAFTHLIHLSQIVSQVTRQLYSASAIEKPKRVLRRICMELEDKFRSWRQSVPVDARPSESLKSNNVWMRKQPLILLQMHLAYYGGILALHSLFNTPWVSHFLDRQHHDEPEDMTEPGVDEESVSSTAEHVVNAARNIIVLSSQIDVTAASTQWTAFSYTLMGITSLFIHILRFPHLETARADLSLLDMAAGHFSRLGLLSDFELDFPFARDLASLARQTVEKRRPAVETSILQYPHQASLVRDDPFLSEPWDSAAFALDDWNILSSLIVPNANESE